MSKFNNEYVKGLLKTQGTRFVNGDGEEIILNGYGTANWENVEGFMIGGPQLAVHQFKYLLWPGEGEDHNPDRWSSRRNVSQTIRELCGTEYLETFWDRWEENHLREEDIKLMAELGYNCVRIVLNANALLYEEPGIKFNEKSFARLTNVIDWCEKYRLYAILDMHGVVGGNNGATGDSLFCEFPSVFLDEESTERQIVLWEEIVRRYGSRWIIAGYDLINEPVSSPIQHQYIPLLAKYYDECIARLRKIDKEHIMFLEGAKYARDMRIFDHDFDPEFHNWAISIHLYGASPEIKDLYPWLLKCRECNVPLWLGECGSKPVHNAVFYDICAHYGVAWTPWAWKTADAGGHGPRSVGHPLPKDWEKIQKYVKGGPRPSYAESQKIMDEYIELTKLEHCSIGYEGHRLNHKKPDINLPGAGYDMFLEDGSRYYGTWELSNYLDFRLEDHTKLVWATTKAKPYPAFNWYEDKNKEHYDPLEDLALELQTGEFANYTVRDVDTECKVTVYGIGEGTADLFANGMKIGSIALKAGSILEPQAAETLTIGSGEEVIVKVVVTSGCLTIKSLDFKL